MTDFSDASRAWGAPPGRRGCQAAGRVLRRELVRGPGRDLAPAGARLPAVAGLTLVVATRLRSSLKLPISTPQSASVHVTLVNALIVLIASRNGLIFAPPGRVLNVSPSDAMVTAFPPAAFDRSEITGMGVKIVSMTGWSGLVASTSCFM